MYGLIGCGEALKKERQKAPQTRKTVLNVGGNNVKKISEKWKGGNCVVRLAPCGRSSGSLGLWMWQF